MELGRAARAAALLLCACAAVAAAAAWLGECGSTEQVLRGAGSLRGQHREEAPEPQATWRRLAKESKEKEPDIPDETLRDAARREKELHLSVGPDGVGITASGGDGERPWHHHVTSRHKEDPLQAIIVGVLQSLAVFGIAYWYREIYSPRRYPEGENASQATRVPEMDGGSFSYGLFDEKEWWGEDLTLCACALVCWPIRWAETVSSNKVALTTCSFYAVLGFALLGLDAWNQVDPLTLYPFGVTHVVFVLGAVYFRQKLRRQYGLNTALGTLCTDFLAWWCCPQCSTAQEARQVERVRLPTEEDERAVHGAFNRLEIPSRAEQGPDEGVLDTERTDATVASDAPLMRSYENQLNRVGGSAVD